MSARVYPDSMVTESMVPTPSPPQPSAGTNFNTLVPIATAMGKRAMGAILPFKKKTSIGVAPPEPEFTPVPPEPTQTYVKNDEYKEQQDKYTIESLRKDRKGGRKSRKRRISRKRRVSRKFKKTRRPKRRKQ